MLDFHSDCGFALEEKRRKYSRDVRGVKDHGQAGLTSSSSSQITGAAALACSFLRVTRVLADPITTGNPKRLNPACVKHL